MRFRPASSLLRRGLATAVAAAFALPLAAGAQGAPTVSEIVRNLRGTAPVVQVPAAQQQDAGEPAEGRTRGWSVKGSASEAKAARKSQVVNSYSETRIHFEFGSDQLTPQTLRVLDVFAEAISTPELVNFSFVLEGHTDAIGSEAFNLDLSRRRAESVVRYLVSRGVDPRRLAARGKGKNELAVSDDPASALNRRVVWITQN